MLLTNNISWYLYNKSVNIASIIFDKKGIMVNKKTTELRHGSKRFIINRLNNIRFRNAKCYPINRRNIL